MTLKRDLINQEEIDKCLRYVSDSSNKSAQGQLLKLLQDMQITLDEPKVEDSIEGTRVHVTYTVAIGRKGGELNEDVLRFQYIKEIPVDYNKIPIRLRDNNTTGIEPGRGNSINPHSGNAHAEDPLIESYEELEKGVPTLYEVLGLLKRMYFIPEDFSNRLVVDRIHRLRNMFSKDEIFNLPSIDLNDKVGLIPI